MKCRCGYYHYSFENWSKIHGKGKEYIDPLIQVPFVNDKVWDKNEYDFTQPYPSITWKWVCQFCGKGDGHDKNCSFFLNYPEFFKPLSKKREKTPSFPPPNPPKPDQPKKPDDENTKRTLAGWNKKGKITFRQWKKLVNVVDPQQEFTLIELLELFANLPFPPSTTSSTTSTPESSRTSSPDPLLKEMKEIETELNLLFFDYVEDDYLPHTDINDWGNKKNYWEEDSWSEFLKDAYDLDDLLDRKGKILTTFGYSIITHYLKKRNLKAIEKFKLESPNLWPKELEKEVQKLKERINDEKWENISDTGWLTDDNIEFIFKSSDWVINTDLHVSENPNLIRVGNFAVRTDIANIYNAFYKAKTSQEWDLADLVTSEGWLSSRYTIFPLRVSGNHWGLFVIEKKELSLEDKRTIEEYKTQILEKHLDAWKDSIGKDNSSGGGVKLPIAISISVEDDKKKEAIKAVIRILSDDSIDQVQQLNELNDLLLNYPNSNVELNDLVKAWKEINNNSIGYRAYYTSSGRGVNSEVEQIKPLITQLTDASTANSITILNGQKQTDGYNCGVFLIFYVKEILENQELKLTRTYSDQEIANFRQFWRSRVGEDEWCKVDHYF